MENNCNCCVRNCYCKSLTRPYNRKPCNTDFSGNTSCPKGYTCGCDNYVNYNVHPMCDNIPNPLSICTSKYRNNKK
jgi:hypothetical protein